MKFSDFTDGSNPVGADYLVGYATGGGSGSDRRWLRSTLANPPTTDGMALGSTSLMWSDLFLASGGVINWNNGTISLTETSGSLNIQSATATMFFRITATDSGSNGPIFDLFHNSSSPANLDNVGIFRYIGKDDAGNSETYVQHNAIIADVVNGSEDSAYDTYLQIGGALTQKTRLDGSGLWVNPATATPSGGSQQNGIRQGSSQIGVYFGSGAPTLSAAQGSIYLRTDGGASTRIYSNNNGSNGWSAITSA